MPTAPVLRPGPEGTPRAPRGTRVVVIGGGVGGLAAATVLAERGVEAIVVEKERFLGGRAGSWPDTLNDGTPFGMERGFHAFFRQYYNLRRLLRRVDPQLDNLVPLDDYPLIGPGGAEESFAGLSRRTPLNVLHLLWRTPRVRLTDLPRLDHRLGSALLAYDADGTDRALDAIDAKRFLDGLNFPAPARQMLFDVFAHSFFNPEGDYSAAELVRMFHFYFLANPEGLVFDTSRRPFSAAFFDPLGERIERLGGDVRRRQGARSIARGQDGWTVELAGGEALTGVDGVVLALDVPGLKRLVAASPGLAPLGRQIRSLDVTAPFVVWRLFLDRAVDDGRRAFVGTCGLGALDNISVYDRFDEGSRAYRAQTGGSVVELHAYAIDEGRGDADLRAELLRTLRRVYPETAEANVVDERYLRRQDCPAFPPGGESRRPGVITYDPSLVLAGDFVKLPYPAALMERAAASGVEAANHLLARVGAEGEPVWTVAPHGMLKRAPADLGLPAPLPRGSPGRPDALR